MRSIINSLFKIALVTALLSCDKSEITDDELTLNKRPYTGDHLRIDGYYYLMDDHGINAIYFFYRNGIIIHRGGWINDNLEELENNFETANWSEIKDSKLKWGIFQIDEHEILFERWYPSSGGPTPAYIRSGDILNDTTFIITKSVRPKTGEEKVLNEVYHFREFSPKPDSTNNFIR